jgi:hypothetical protein
MSGIYFGRRSAKDDLPYRGRSMTNYFCRPRATNQGRRSIARSSLSAARRSPLSDDANRKLEIPPSANDGWVIGSVTTIRPPASRFSWNDLVNTRRKSR